MPFQRTLLLASALAVASQPTVAGTRASAQILYSDDPHERAFQQSAGFSDAVILADGTIYLSGIVVGPEADTAAYERAYRRIGAILTRAGASWDDVVDITSFHTEIEPQVAVMSEVQKQFLTAPYPAWTAVQVSRLYLEAARTEIKVVAKRPAG